MKVAIIGNMNNNGFSMLRYFRDLGVDCYLLLFADDGKNNFKHFDVDSDTWNINAWSNYIFRTKIYSGYKALIGNPLKLKLPVSKKYLHSITSSFDVVISSGSFPALCHKLGCKLDIFFPYSIGVEYLGSTSTLSRLDNANFLIKNLVRWTAWHQREGIKSTRMVINADTGSTEAVLNSIGIQSKKLPIPMLYVEKDFEIPINHRVRSLKDRLVSSDYVVFSHVRHLWHKKKGFTKEQWHNTTKNNDWLIHGFKKIKDEFPNLKITLVLCEYGDDVIYSKKLISDLKISEFVIWLPLISRKEIMYLLRFVNICVGEFYNSNETLWGGSGWEFLASGKTFLQSFRFDKQRFREIFGYNPPNILSVTDKDSVYKQLRFCIDNPDKVADLGADNRKWFEDNIGNSLAIKWLRLLENLH